LAGGQFGLAGGWVVRGNWEVDDGLGAAGAASVESVSTMSARKQSKTHRFFETTILLA
jgi:hypothetical protein